MCVFLILFWGLPLHIRTMIATWKKSKSPSSLWERQPSRHDFRQATLRPITSKTRFHPTRKHLASSQRSTFLETQRDRRTCKNPTQKILVINEVRWKTCSVIKAKTFFSKGTACGKHLRLLPCLKIGGVISWNLVGILYQDTEIRQMIRTVKKSVSLS